MDIKTIKFHRGICIGLKADVFEISVKWDKKDCIRAFKSFFSDCQIGRAYDGSWLFSKDLHKDHIEEVAFYYREGVARPCGQNA